MSLKKFGPNDIVLNTMRTHPSCEFFVAESQIYYNNIPYTSGTLNQGFSVPVTAGCVSLYEMNVDRISSSATPLESTVGGRWIGGSSEANEQVGYSLKSSDSPWFSGPGATPGGGLTTQYEYSY